MSAFVEIEFDNADGRFPTSESEARVQVEEEGEADSRGAERTGKPTLLLRRTIGLKKDEYQLDRKSTSKGEVMSILESAGFSRSNPYYIVPQGRVRYAPGALGAAYRSLTSLLVSSQITHLTNQKDADRLALLKEVAGTKVYEERRAESTKIMNETSEPSLPSPPPLRSHRPRRLLGDAPLLTFPPSRFTRLETPKDYRPAASHQ